MHQFFQTSGLRDIQVKQSVWQDTFQSGDDMYDFIASSTANFYASFIPDQVIDPVLDDIRQYFVKKKIPKITLDVIFTCHVSDFRIQLLLPLKILSLRGQPSWL